MDCGCHDLQNLLSGKLIKKFAVIGVPSFPPKASGAKLPAKRARGPMTTNPSHAGWERAGSVDLQDEEEACAGCAVLQELSDGVSALRRQVTALRWRPL